MTTPTHLGSPSSSYAELAIDVSTPLIDAPYATSDQEEMMIPVTKEGLFTGWVWENGWLREDWEDILTLLEEL